MFSTLYTAQQYLRHLLVNICHLYIASPTLQDNYHEEATYWHSKYPGDPYRRLHLCRQNTVCPRPYQQRYALLPLAPRRFGKFLLLSSLEEIFKGNKALFEGCHIAERNDDWQPYAVGLSASCPKILSAILAVLSPYFPTNFGEDRSVHKVPKSKKTFYKLIIRAPRDD